MGILSAAKALLTSDGIIEKGSAAIDALHLSKEENAELDVKYIEAKAKLLEASGPSAITRRILAVVTALYWLICNIAWLFIWFITMFYADGDLSILKELSNHIADRVNPIFMLVMVFYFGVRAFEKLGK